MYKESSDNEKYYKLLNDLKKEISKLIIGQEKIIEYFLIGILGNGHVLIEGAPGLAKTTLVRTIATIVDCKFTRVQFTPDLLPSDILGINMFNKETNQFHIERGPIFTNLLLADEINRASSKVQSALLECMAERQVTIGNQSIILEKPFLVFATENPVESLGTYALPQAQLDRFFLKIIIDYPTDKEEKDILDRTIEGFKYENLEKILSPQLILEMQEIVRNIFISEDLKNYIVKIINVTRSPKDYELKLANYIEWGVGPRGTIALTIAAKAKAFINNRDYVIDQDIKDVIENVLRHRILLNYEGQAKKIKPEHVLKEILNTIENP